MTQYGAPFDGILIGDATVAPYSASEWARIWKLQHGAGIVFPNYGVFAGSGDATHQPLEVNATLVASTNVEVQIGAGLIDGRFYENTAVVTLAVGANASGNPRIDTVILRLDYIAQTVRLVVKQGTPAGSPVRPAMQQDATYWEIPLADLLLANGFSTIAQSVISQRQRAIRTQSNGWQAHAYPLNYAWGASLGVTFALSPAQTVLIPFGLLGNMLLDNVVVRIAGTGAAVSVRWDLYIEDTNDGNTSENTIRRIVEGGNVSASLGVVNQAIPASTPVPLTPGIYWLAIQNTHASLSWNLDSANGNAFDSADNAIRHKVTTNPNGATLNAVTGWTNAQSYIPARLHGRVFGQTTAL